MKLKFSIKLFIAMSLFFRAHVVSGTGAITVPGGEPATFNNMTDMSVPPYYIIATSKSNLGEGWMQAPTGNYLFQATLSIEKDVPDQKILFEYNEALTVDDIPMTWASNGTSREDASKVITMVSDQGGIINFKVGYKLYLYRQIYPCRKFTISYRVSNMLGQEIIGWKHIDIYPFPYGNSSLFSGDLMIRDNLSDKGIQPYPPAEWNNDYRKITQSPDIWNNWDSHLLTNDHQNPMHSIRTPPNTNTLRVMVINRSCAYITPESKLYMYWTIARLWEPWAHDWLNWQAEDAYSGASNTNFPNPNKITYQGTDYPLGNPITMNGTLGYRAAAYPRTLTSYAASMAFPIDVAWKVPDPAWYLGQANFPIEYASANGNPVICFLARIEEPWQPANGYYTSPVMTENGPENNVVTYASKNNNVATRNMYILNSQGGYKRQPFANGDFYGNSGLIMINNPESRSSINIAMANNDGSIAGRPQFTDNGQVNLYLDALVWDRWVAGGSHGQNVEVVDDQIIRITNSDFASLDSIVMDSSEISWMAIETQYYAGSPPVDDYTYSFSIGPYEETPQVMIGAPTQFQAAVLSSPHVTIDPADFYNDPETGPPIVAVTSTPVQTGLNENSDTKTNLSVYPNPAKENVFVNFTSFFDEKVDISVYDLQGKQLKSFEYLSHKGRNNPTIDVSLFNTGIYLVHLKTKDAQNYIKFEVSR